MGTHQQQQMTLLRFLALALAITAAFAHNNTAANQQYHVCDSDLCSEIITDCKMLFAEYHEHGCCGNPDKVLQFIQVGNTHTHNCAALKAQFQQCKTIRDHAGYKPSSGFSLGPSDTNAFGDDAIDGCKSFKWSAQGTKLQINLEYNPRFALVGNAPTGCTSGTQNYWNAHSTCSPPARADGNWVDPHVY